MKFSLKYRGVGHYVFFCINSTSGYTCSYPMIVNGWPQSHHKSISPPELPPPSPMMINNKLSQEPIIRSFYLSYLHSESTLFRIFLFLEAPSTGFFAGVYIIANHKRAVVLYCYVTCRRHESILIMAKSVESLPFFGGCYANVSVFSREIE